MCGSEGKFDIWEQSLICMKSVAQVGERAIPGCCKKYEQLKQVTKISLLGLVLKLLTVVRILFPER